MSPFQHGGVFVTEDGAETDLDLGHYEAFYYSKMHKANNFTTGQIYQNVLRRRKDAVNTSARPFRSSLISPMKFKTLSFAVLMRPEILISQSFEIGGTVGDIESLPFLEAVRQMSPELGANNSCFIHLTLVPYIPKCRRVKDKADSALRRRVKKNRYSSKRSSLPCRP